MSRIASAAELPLADLYRLLYAGKVGTAWKRALKAADHTPLEELRALLAPDLPALTAAQRAIMLNRPLRMAWKQDFGSEFQWAADPVEWVHKNSFRLQDLKKWLERETGIRTPALSADTKKFLRGWVNTNTGARPYPTRETVIELRPYRPAGPVLLYRGMRFTSLEALVAFHEEYSTGKPFPFTSEWITSWSTSRKVAERFARYRPSESNDAGTLAWLGRAQRGKNYDGRGGYVIAARVRPEDCLVDLTRPDLPDWGWSQHGGEGEVIVLPGRAQVAKVVEVVGDVAREVQEFRTTKFSPRATPVEERFWKDWYPVRNYEYDLDGDTVSGTVTFTPRAPGFPPAREEGGPYLLGLFGRNLYRAQWVDENTLRYEEMRFPGSEAERAGRVALRWLNGH